MLDALGVAVSTIASFTVGAIWYGLLGAAWMRAVGKTTEEIQADQAPTPYVVAALASLASAVAFYLAYQWFGLSGPADGAALGLVAGLLVGAPWIVMHYAFADRPLALWWIDGGHTVLALTIGGAALGLFL